MKKYNIIYADPPWQYKNKTTGRGHKSGAKGFYAVLGLEDIEAMPIKKLSQENAVLFIWATVPVLPSCFSVISNWGFTYKTIIIWEKTGLLGMGNWVRVQEEILIVAVRGKVKPFGHQEKNIYRHPICDHSAKPHFFRELVMKLGENSFGQECERLELFARSRNGFFPDYEYNGWDVYGNEVNNSIKLPE